MIQLDLSKYGIEKNKGKEANTFNSLVLLYLYNLQLYLSCFGIFLLSTGTPMENIVMS